jgi:hypothetical protein
MNIKLKAQKVQMQIAINYLSLIEVCDENIRLKNEVDYYKEKKKEYIEKYTEVFVDIVAHSIVISKVEIFNEL